VHEFVEIGCAAQEGRIRASLAVQRELRGLAKGGQLVEDALDVRCCEDEDPSAASRAEVEVTAVDTGPEQGEGERRIRQVKRSRRRDPLCDDAEGDDAARVVDGGRDDRDHSGAPGERN